MKGPGDELERNTSSCLRGKVQSLVKELNLILKSNVATPIDLQNMDNGWVCHFEVV